MSTPYPSAREPNPAEMARRFLRAQDRYREDLKAGGPTAEAVERYDAAVIEYEIHLLQCQAVWN